jgi:membrane protease YdiL (CAAX protease family)
MIRQDNISRAMFVVAVLISIYLATYQTTTLVLFPIILLVTGLVMEYSLERRGTGFKKEDSPDTTTDRKEVASTGYWALLGFAGIMLSGYAINFTNYISSLSALAVTNYDLILFSSLMAVSEEMFFRGFVLELCLVTFKVGEIAVFASAGVFAVYHLARYGTQLESLVYVFAGGLILSFITWKSKRLGPSILAHVGNNVIATMAAIL